MSFLLDTHAVIWFAQEPERLGKEARNAIIGNDEAKFISMATFWEIGIKQGLGKLKLDVAVEEFAAEQRRNTFRVLEIELPHVAHVATLPLHHRDPFDRMLIAQAAVEGLQIITMDASFAPYGVPCIW